MNDKELAKAYVVALEVGAVKLSEVVSWADSLILNESEPDIEVIELASCKTPSEAITHLNNYSDKADESMSNRLLFGLFYNALNEGRCNHSQVAKKLYFRAMEDDSLSRFAEIFGFWDDIDLAEEGITGDPNAEKKKLLEFLQREKA